MTVGTSKTPANMEYYERDPFLKYFQHGYSSCIFSSLAYDFVVSCESVAEHAIDSSIEEYLN